MPVSARRKPLSSCFPPSSLARLRFHRGGAFPTSSPRRIVRASAVASLPRWWWWVGARSRCLTRMCSSFPGRRRGAHIAGTFRRRRCTVSMQRLLLPSLKAFTGSRSVGLLVHRAASRVQVPSAAGSHHGSPAGVKKASIKLTNRPAGWLPPCHFRTRSFPGVQTAP